MNASGPFFVVMNAGSGRHSGQERKDTVQRVLRGGGRDCEIQLVRRARQLPSAIAAALQQAKANAGVVVAAGGDGTINAVVQRVLGSGVVFAALPQGTYNFFGRNQGLSEDLETAARDLLDAEHRAIQVGLVNDRVVLINASLGMYRRLLQDRERFNQRLGRGRLVALWAGLNTLLRRQQLLDLRIQTATARIDESVLSLVVGNNRLQFERMGIEHAELLEHGLLLGIRLRPQSRMALLGTALRGLAGRWADNEFGESFAFRELTVDAPRSRRRSVRIAIDGEIERMALPLRFRVAEHSLDLLVPRSSPAAADQAEQTT